jgi:hypothetical protein
VADGRRVFSLTEAGAGEAAALWERLGDEPWGATGGEQDPRFALWQAVSQFIAAAKQVGVAGTSDDVQSALQILCETRKREHDLFAAAERRGWVSCSFRATPGVRA